MDRQKFLEQEILRHKELYYKGTPEVSDADFDKLEDELKKLNPDNPVLNVVGTKVSNTNKIAHETKMLSLDKTYSKDDLVKWVEENETLSMFKIDGVSCSLIYEDGKLILGKTRGDGSFGEDITDKILWIDSIPKTIAAKEKLEIRGELYCTESDFFHLSEEFQKLNLDAPSSQRNIVAGLIGRKEQTFLAKNLSFQGFDLIGKKGLKKELEKFKFLKSYQFETPDVKVINQKKVKSEVDSLLKETEEFMSSGEYLIDGLVLVYNDIETQNGLGETSHHPRFKMAFKFQGETKTTKIKELIWSVSRNGVLTPVANVEAVELSGAKISRVTLHNFGMVDVHKLKKGDEIEIVRSGEVIPKFLQVVKSSKSQYQVPEVCPSCGEPIQSHDIRLICVNDKCPGKNKESILHFVQKIGIDDLSSKRLDQMIEKKMIATISDLYKLKKESLLELDKFKDKLADKILGNIEKSKEADLPTFLSALGISGGGYNKCEKVVQNGFDTIEKIKGLAKESLMEIDSFAEKSAEEFSKSLKEKIKLIEDLEASGFEFKIQEIADNPVKGKKICITGSLSRKRSEIEKDIRFLGGIVVSSVGKTTDFLLTNDTESSSSKFKKAQQLEIPIVDEAWLSQFV